MARLAASALWPRAAELVAAAPGRELAGRELLAGLEALATRWEAERAARMAG